MAELNNVTDRDLLVQLLVNQANIEKKIDSFGVAIAEVHSRIDRVENKLDEKFTSINNNCREQRSDCNTCIDGKLSSGIFYWFVGLSSPIILGSGAWFVIKIMEFSEKLNNLTMLVESIKKVLNL